MASRYITPVFDGGKGVTPADGLQLFFFLTGTSTPKDTFSDAAGTVPNANPVISDANGVFPDIFISGTYKVQLKDKNGVSVGFVEADPVNETVGVGDANNDLRYGTIFATVAAMTAANPVSIDGVVVTLVAGMTVSTQGYTVAGDGGGATYLIVAPQAADGFGDHTLANGNVAVLQEYAVGEVKASQYGALSAVVSTASAAFQAAIDSGRKIKADGVYTLKQVQIKTGTYIYGNGTFQQDLADPLNVFDFGGVVADDVTIEGVTFDGRRKSGLVTIPGTRTRANALIFMGVSGGSKSSNITLNNVSVKEAIHFHVACDQLDGVTVTNLSVDGDGLDSVGANFLGNTDGLHLTNCSNATVDVVHGLSGDDLVACTIDGANNSENISISNVRGRSQEASCVVVTGESSATGQFNNVSVSNVVTDGSKNDAVRISAVDTGFTLAGIFNVKVSGIVADSVRYGAWIRSVTGCTVSDVTTDSTKEHGVQLQSVSDFCLSSVSTKNSGQGTADFNGVQVSSSTFGSINNIQCKEDSRWGLQAISCSDISIDGVVTQDCGSNTGLGVERGGIRVHLGTRTTVGASCRSRESGAGNTNYGLYLSGASSEVEAFGEPSSHQGVTFKAYAPGSGTTLFNQVNIELVLSDDGATLTTLSSKGIGTITRNAAGDYTVPFIGTLVTDEYKVTGSARTGVAESNTDVYPVSSVSTSMRVFVSNETKARVARDKVFITVHGRYVSI